MSYCTADARKEFDSWSRRYDWDPLQLFLFQPSHRMLLDLLTPTDERILDVGCGTGVFATQILRRFPDTQVWGLDLSAGMLARAQTRAPMTAGRLHLVQGDSERLPFADDSFDVVTCIHSFHHYPRQDRVVAEMHRVLRPGGRLFIVDGDRDRWWGHLIFQVLVVMVEGSVLHPTGRAFRALYRAHGFDNVYQRRRRGPLPFLLTVGRAVKATHPRPLAA
jgi:ubiquinone/menaquinone biosynthesis C-methylase UbiE